MDVLRVQQGPVIFFVTLNITMKVKGGGFSIKGSNGTAVAIVAVAVILAGVAMKYGGKEKENGL